MLLAVNKSPLRHVVKAGVSISALSEKMKRRRFTNDIHLDNSSTNALRELEVNGHCLLDGIVDLTLAESIQELATEKINRASEIKQLGLTSKKDFWIGLLDEDLKLDALKADS